MVQCWYICVREEIGFVRWKESTVLCVVLSELSVFYGLQLCHSKLGGAVRSLCPALLFKHHRVQDTRGGP